MPDPDILPDRTTSMGDGEGGDTQTHVTSIRRKRTPTILLKHANLTRKEKRSKKEKLKGVEEDGQTPKRSAGRFTIAFNKKKQQQRSPAVKSKQVSPTKR